MAEARTKGRRGEAGKGSRESQTQGLAGPGSTEKLAVKDDPGAGEESENTQTPEVPLAEPRSGLQNWPRRAQKPGDVPLSQKALPVPQSVRPGRAATRGDGQQAHLRRSDTCALVKVTGQSWGGQRVPRSSYSWPQAFQRAPSCCWSGQGPDPFRLQWISELQGGKSKSLRP